MSMPSIQPELATGYQIEQIVAGSEFHSLNGVAFGPDGRLFAASVAGESIFALDLATGRVETIIGAPEGEADDLIFTKEGEMIWTATLQGIVRRRDLNGHVTNLAQHLPGANSLALTRDGTRLFVGQVFFGEGLWELDLNGVKAPRLVLAKTGGLNAFEFGPDGMIYGPSWFNGTVLRIDPESGEHTVIAKGFEKPGAVRFDASDRLYVLDDATGELFLVDAHDGDKKLVVQLATATDNMAMGPDGLIYVSNMADNSVHAVDPQTGAVRVVIQGKLCFPRALAVAPTPQGDRIYVADSCAYRIVDPGTGDVQDVLRPVASELKFPTAVSANEKHVVLTSELLGTIQILDRATGQIIRELTEFHKPGAAIELADGSVIVSEPSAGRLLQVRSFHRRSVLAEGLNAPVGLVDAGDGTIYVAESALGKLLRVSVPDGKISEVAAGLGAIHSVALLPDGSLVALDSLAGTLLIIDPQAGKSTIIARRLPLGYLQRPYPRSGGIAVAPDGSIYLAVDQDNAIYRIARAP